MNSVPLRTVCKCVNVSAVSMGTMPWCAPVENTPFSPQERSTLEQDLETLSRSIAALLQINRWSELLVLPDALRTKIQNV